MAESKKKVVVIDYESGNLFSVRHACLKVGLETQLAQDRHGIENADLLILPGVGAFSDAMKNLEKRDLVNPIKDHIASGKPFFGICLGMQLLFEESEEFGNTKGLGIIQGQIKKFPAQYNNTKLRIPQIAWNQIKMPSADSWKDTPLEGLKDGNMVYFVHSFYASPAKKENILTTTSYNEFEYCSAVKNNNVFAVQFHPEKSGETGLTIYNNLKQLFLKQHNGA